MFNTMFNKRFIYFFAIIVTFLVSICSVSAQADLNLELTQGIDAALPMTIVPFSGDQPNAPGSESITTIIKNDLENSGQFHVKSRGADDQLTGKVVRSGWGKYLVSFQLISRVGVTSSAGKETILLAKSYEVPQAGLRRVAHHISDLVYQKLTGARGVFSTRIAYVLVQRRRHQASQYRLEVADADGFNPRALFVSTQPIMSPAWSPDGKQLAYVSFEGHRAGIYLQDLATGQRRRVTHYPGVNGAPAFSPDGRSLAIVLTLTGNPKIYQFDLNTKKLTRLTKGYSIDTEPAWASDGQSILFTSNRGGSPQIYRYYLADGRVDRMSFSGNYNARASFIPGQPAIIMMHRGMGLFGIARENLTSGKTDVLVQTGSDESPSVAPNGKMIIYATQYGGRSVLAFVSTDGRIRLRLPAREGAVHEPAWSPYESVLG